MSSWQEPIDLRRGRSPLIHSTATTITYELGILSGEMRTGLFVATPRTRLVLCCDLDGEISARILESQPSC